jgi:ribosomal protein S27E
MQFAAPGLCQAVPWSANLPTIKRDPRMACFGISFNASATETLCCLCGEQTVSPGGPALVLTQKSAVVCRECSKEQAPHLAALLVLAQVAERVGRIKRHTLVPPLEALLALARAAEDYASCASSLVHARGGSDKLEESFC